MRRFVLLLSLAAGCGGSSGEPPTPDGAPTELPPLRVPVLAELRPAEAPLFGDAFTLELLGSDFDADAVVLFEGLPLATRVISPTELAADVPADALTAFGVRAVRVVHGGDDGAASSELGFRVVDGIAEPLVDVLVPDRATVNTPDFEVIVRGWNFYPTSVVHLAGVPRATTYVNASELRFTLATADVAVAGDLPITVVTEPVAPSPSLTFIVELAPIANVQRVSLQHTGAENPSGDAADASVSADGRYVAFASEASDLVPGDGGFPRDIFVRDTCRGAPTGCTPTTIRVSEKLGGGEPSGDSQDPVLSANGRYVAFASGAGDLVAGDTNGLADVFVRDTCLGVASGCTPSTTLVSVGVTGPVFFSIFPSISGDGRFVVFSVNSSTSWLRDTCIGAAGCTPTTIQVDTANDGTPGDRSSATPVISANGRFVAFASNSGNLDGAAVGNLKHVYVVDTCHGATGCTRSIKRIDARPDNVEVNGNVPNGSMAFSADGRFVSFATNANNLVPEPSLDKFQVYRHDTCLGAPACTPTTTMISRTPASEGGDGKSMASVLSGDGRFVAFGSEAPNLVAGDTNSRRDVFVHDTCFGAIGCTPSLRRISIGHDGSPGAGESPPSQEYAPRISDDGLVVTFASRASNLVANDTNNLPDVFVVIGAP